MMLLEVGDQLDKKTEPLASPEETKNQETKWQVIQAEDNTTCSGALSQPFPNGRGKDKAADKISERFQRKRGALRCLMETEQAPWEWDP